MNKLVSHFKYKILIFLLLSCFGNVNGQTLDSTRIADFFSPQNLPQITQSSKDSIYKLIGEDLILQDIYHFQEAKLNLQTGNFDEVIKIVNNWTSHYPKELPPYSKAKFYNIIGSVYANKQETKRAINFFEKALRLSEEANEGLSAAMLESNIANMYFSLVDYESAYQHVAKGYQEMKKHPDHHFYSSLMAILSISEAKIGKMAEAKKHGRIALEIAEKKGDVIALIVSNLALGEVANSEKKYGEAKVYLLTSLELSEKYQQTSFIILNSIGLMTANLGMKEYSSAVQFGEKALDLVSEGGDQTTNYSIKRNLAAAYFETNQPVKAYELMHDAHEIFRTTNSIENKKSINDLLLKYDTEKKEKQLVASKNELLQKKIEQSNLMIILGLLAALTIGLISTIIFIRHRTKVRIALMKTAQEKRVIQAAFDGEEVERERIARELHDGVASNLIAVRYQLMANKRIPQEDKTHFDGILLQAHEDMRRLSHNLAPFSIEKFGFKKALNQFASDNSNENCLITASVIPSEAILPKDKASILYRVAQELTQNAIKHASASEISIQVIVEDKISLIVEDDGKGFVFEQKKDSNGMSSITKRATELNGAFEVDSNPKHGTITKFTIS